MRFKINRVESGTLPSTDASTNKPAETKVSYFKALPVVMEDFVGSKGYKLPSCSKDESKDTNTMPISLAARIPKKTKVDKSEIPHRKTYSSILYTLKQVSIHRFSSAESNLPGEILNKDGYLLKINILLHTHV